MHRYLFWAFLVVPGYAFAQVSWSPGPALTVVQSTVNDGAGGQTDPHLSGDWLVYTDNSINSVRFENLDLGFASDQIIPHADGTYESLSDISGNAVVFTHVAPTGVQAIYLVQIDPLGNPGPSVEVSPSPASIRRHSAVGGDTIAYEDRSYGGSSAFPPEITLSSAADPSAPGYRLTNDTIPDQDPTVSPDGNAVVWVKCAADPGQHPQLGVLTLVRTASDERDVINTGVAARPGEGVLCVENANATAAWVVLNGNTEIGPASFKHAATSTARAVALEENNSLTAMIAGAQGTSYTLRIYGTPDCIPRE